MPVEVLRGADLTVTAGGSVAVTGPSGSGKTTLLHLMGALDTPDAGEIRVTVSGSTRLRKRRGCDTVTGKWGLCSKITICYRN